MEPWGVVGEGIAAWGKSREKESYDVRRGRGFVVFAMR